MPDPDLEMGERGGGVGGRHLPKIIFALWTLVWFKNKGGTPAASPGSTTDDDDDDDDVSDL